MINYLNQLNNLLSQPFFSVVCNLASEVGLGLYVVGLGVTVALAFEVAGAGPLYSGAGVV